MKLLRKRDIPEEKYSNAFLGFGPEESHFVVELTFSTFMLSLYFYSEYFLQMAFVISVMLGACKFYFLSNS